MTQLSNQRRIDRKRLLWMAGAIVLAAAVLIALGGGGAFRGSRVDNTQPLFEVAEGPLTISVTESGTVQPTKKVVIKNEVEGTTTILYLIPEGTRVEKGELLVQLDASKLEDSKVDQEIRVHNAEAAFIAVQENLEVVRNKAQSDVDKAELTLRFAQGDLKNYEEGEYPNQVKELEARITLANEELQRAEDRLDWSRKLFEKKYLSESELKADELAANKAKLDLELAMNNLALLKDYTYKRTLDQRESDVKQAEMALERTRRSSSADVVQAEANLKARESEFTREQGKLEKSNDQIKKTRIEAPSAGVVVHATSAQGGFGPRMVQPLDEGQGVRERQELIHLLPSDTGFKVEGSIHESSLQMIIAGLPVRITVDALPGQSFSGKVVSIAPLPNAQSAFMNPDLKVYDTKIEIEGGRDVLRSGMTCKAEIIVEQYASATYVPVQSVVRVGGQPTVFLKNEHGIEQRHVEVGLDNNRMIRILSGLAPGENVLLNPPLEAAAAVTESYGQVESKPAGGKEPTAGAPPEPLPEAVGGKVSPPPESQPSASQQPATGDGPPRGGGENLTPEEQERLRERFESMSPEERQAMRERREQRQQTD